MMTLTFYSKFKNGKMLEHKISWKCPNIGRKYYMIPSYRLIFIVKILKIATSEIISITALKITQYGFKMCICPLAPISIAFKPIALRKAKNVYNFGLSECNRVNGSWSNNAFTSTL